MKNLKIHIFTSLVILTPILTFAQGPDDNFGAIGSFFESAIVFINSVLIPFVFAVALLMFVYGMFKYFILGGDDSTKREEGKQLALYAVAGFVLMVGIWGIVLIIANGLNIVSEAPDLPMSI